MSDVRKTFDNPKRQRGMLNAGVDRSGGAAHFPLKRAVLATVKATTWKPEECPLCRAGSQAVKPGSRV